MAGRVGWGLLLLLVLALFASGVVCQPGDGAASEETTPARQCPDYTWRTCMEEGRNRNCLCCVKASCERMYNEYPGTCHWSEGANPASGAQGFCASLH
mmetsp:Transcript_25001/g.57098  ORF Transcript_25001/g.57098 Transcript_25001/m.57098 type:complete len:98 (-) Transcript_25001:295-588(-)